MAGSLRPRHKLAAVLFTLALGLPWPLPGQIRLTPAQVNQREGPDFAPAYAGKRVLIEGVVNTPAMHFPEYTALAIQDDRGGAILTVPAPRTDFDGYHPGTLLRVTGTVSLRLGMPVVEP